MLLPDGTVSLCCMDMGLDYIVGNLLTQSFDEILYGDVLKNLRRCLRSEKYGDCICRHCCEARKTNYFKLIRRKVGLRTRIRQLFKKEHPPHLTHWHSGGLVPRNLNILNIEVIGCYNMIWQ